MGQPAGFTGPIDALTRYRSLMSAVGIDVKGAAMPYTSRNGHMFSFLDMTGTMSLRLDRHDRDAFLQQYATTLSEQHGRIMKEYVRVPAELVLAAAELAEWVRRSDQWVSGLRPRSTSSR